MRNEKAKAAQDTLFSLTGDLLSLWDMRNDLDVDDEAWTTSFQMTAESYMEKLDGYGCYLKNLKADIAGDEARIKAFKETIKEMETHLKAKENRYDRARKAISESMLAIGEPKVKTEKFSFSARPTRKIVYADGLVLGDVPAEYLVADKVNELKVERNTGLVDREKVEAALESGAGLGWACIKEDVSLTIR